MRTLIIDDEPDAIDALRIIIEELLPELEIIGSYSNSTEALEDIPQLNPGLVLLDINMPGLNGFELLESLKDRNFKTIFITAYDDYAIKAFKYSAVDYILKPIDIDELVSAVKRSISPNKGPGESDELKYKKLFEIIKGNQSEKLVITTYDGTYYIDPQDVIYVQADSNYSSFIFNNAKELFVAKGLKDFADLLPSTYFFRSHHSFLINLNFVRRYMRNEGGSIEMVNGAQIPLARRKKNEFYDLMKKLIKNG
ncbi:MAG: hypothetical protein B6I20_13675 [Bacteroidetes bacterium 4572_117]|nr:MAG: hypothetical protein B6I20_13675 [Bacteroidetes bacterium 4572_117]